MCTLTWIWKADGYFLAFNRDERRTRALGRGPRTIARAGVQALAPLDVEAGGTWIAVNELGVTLALLNGYRFQTAEEPANDPARAWSSRGELIPEACDLARAEELAARIGALDLRRYRPFDLLAFDAGGRARLASWTGTTLESRGVSAEERPFVSSSFDDDGTRRERRASFSRSVGAAGGERELELFHASHEPERGPYSPCMHRDDAHTVSFTRVRVTARTVELEYQPGSPCAAAPSERASLPRRDEGARLPFQAAAPWNSSKR